MVATWLWFALGALAAAPHAPPLKRVYELPAVNARTACFPSGLKVVMVERPGTGTATSVWLIDGGQADDPEGAGGSMHMIEHLWFRSHPERGEEFRRAASELSPGAFTLVDTTVFHASASVSDLGPMLELHSWVLAAPLQDIDEEVFATERDVVRAEAWYRHGHSDRAALRMLDRVLYPKGHPYHDSMTRPEELEGLTLETVSQVAAEQYVADGATLYIEADLPPTGIEALVIESLPSRLTAGTGSSCERTHKPRIPKDVATDELLEVKGPRWRPAVYISWALPPLTAADEAIMELAGRQLQSNIRRQLVGVPGLNQSSPSTESVRCGDYYGRLSTQYTCVIDLPFGVEAIPVVKAVKRAIANSANEMANDDFRNRQIIAKFASDLMTAWLEDFESQASPNIVDRALQAHHTGTVSGLRDRLDGLGAADHAAMAAFTKEWFQPERMGAIFVEPDLGPELDLNRISGQASLLVSERAWTPVESDVAIATRVLPSGLEVWAVQRANAPVAHVDLVFGGGNMRDPEPGTNEFLQYLARHRMPGANFGDLKLDLGMTTYSHFGNWTNSSSVSGTAGNADAAIWVHRAKLEGITWDISNRQNVLDKSVNYSLGKYQSLPQVFASPMAYARLFPGHRAGMAWWERNKAARYVGEGLVRRWLKQVYRPENGKLLVVSSRPVSEIDSLVDKYFAGFKGKGKVDELRNQTEALPPPPTRMAMAFAFDAEVSHASAYCRVPGVGPQSIAISRVSRAALAKALFESLRSEGGSYATGAHMDPMTPELAVLQLSAEVGPLDGGNAVKAMLAVIEALATGEHPDFVAGAVRGARADWGRSWSSASRASGLLRMAAAWGIAPDQLANMGEQMANVTAADVADFLGDCAGHEVVTLIGPDAAARMQAVGLDAEEVDWKARRDLILQDLK